MMIKRIWQDKLADLLKHSPAVALLGPRQVGKKPLL
jgi:predicted AAA+ superfamily ATPase